MDHPAQIENGKNERLHTTLLIATFLTSLLVQPGPFPVYFAPVMNAQYHTVCKEYFIARIIQNEDGADRQAEALTHHPIFRRAIEWGKKRFAAFPCQLT